MSRLIRKQRSGKVLVFIGIMLIILLTMVALVVDVGWVMVARTQLHAAADAGSLAGGTELLPGLGANAFRTPAEVELRAKEQAEIFTELHEGGEAILDIEGARDVRLGKASLDRDSGVWNFEWGVSPYNAVGVTTRRSEIGTQSGDRPLPLFLGPVIGYDEVNVTRFSVAVILPASGIRIPPGANFNSGLSPFAYLQETWEKYQRAQQHYEENNLTATDLESANGGTDFVDPLDGSPLYYEVVQRRGRDGAVSGGSIELRQLFGDRYRVVDPELDTASNIVEESDGVLEANIFPVNSEAGNFGTVDIGGLDNSTNVLQRQITDGVSEEDLAQHENNEINPSEGEPIQLQGDTGISAGIESSLESILGQCRVILLYTSVVNPGNNALYTIVDLTGIRIMEADLRGRDKVLVIQPCSVSDPGGIPDFDEEIGDETSFFTSLILAR